MEIKTGRFFEAFTLAEVLITLGIIGVVAAMTIPTLVSNYQKTQYVSQLQKMTAVLNSGFKQLMANTSCNDIPCTGIIGADSNTTIDNLKNANVFDIINSCPLSVMGCHDNYVYPLSNDTALWIPHDHYSMIVFKDGSVLGLYNDTYVNCNLSGGISQYASVCFSSAIIDINGSKPPNKFGRDVYRFVLSKNGEILPIGTVNSTSLWNGNWDSDKTTNCIVGVGDGATCFGRIVEQGWEMKY